MTKDSELNVTTYVRESVWAEFVRKHPKGNIFQTPEMIEVYKPIFKSLYAPFALIFNKKASDSAYKALIAYHCF